jgi:hypothetical protein
MSERKPQPKLPKTGRKRERPAAREEPGGRPPATPNSKTSSDADLPDPDTDSTPNDQGLFA